MTVQQLINCLTALPGDPNRRVVLQIGRNELDSGKEADHVEVINATLSCSDTYYDSGGYHDPDFESVEEIVNIVT